MLPIISHVKILFSNFAKKHQLNFNLVNFSWKFYLTWILLSQAWHVTQFLCCFFFFFFYIRYVLIHVSLWTWCVTEECSLSTFPATLFFFNCQQLLPLLWCLMLKLRVRVVSWAYHTSALPETNSVEEGGHLIKCRGWETWIVKNKEKERCGGRRKKVWVGARNRNRQLMSGDLTER